MTSDYKLDLNILVPEINMDVKTEPNSKKSDGDVGRMSGTKNKEVLEKTDKNEGQNENQSVRRRKHKNSKNGCPNCKKRRVKCSENLPACTNCVRRKVRCGYLDYTEEQLNDLRQSKFVVENADNYNGEQTKKQSDTRNSSIKSSEVQQTSPSSLNTLRTSNSFSASQEKSNDNVPGASYNDDFLWNENFDNSYDVGVSSVLNFQGNIVNSDGDNLLATSEYPIVYPVYSMKYPNRLPGYHNTDQQNVKQNPSFKPSRDVFNSGAFGTVSRSLLWKDSFVSPLNSDYMEYSPDLNIMHNKGMALPGAIERSTSFRIINKPSINYGQLIHELMIKFGPQLASGTCSLEDNIYLYSMWLHSFIEYSFTQKLMFGCMVNFTTNYLISNCWMPEFISGSFTALIDRTKVRNLLISSSIRHYAMAIKELRTILNKDSDPLLCSSASFVLSLTYIYDPSATPRSMNCFRDGLFGILQHSVTTLTKDGKSLPFMLMMHMEILKNIVRSVYLPAYDPKVLYEYRSMLTLLGNIIKMLNASSPDDGLNSKDMYARKFIEKKINDLMVFTNETINSFVPAINNNLDNLDIQQQTLFEMLHKWVRIFPTKSMFITYENGPVENVLFLFYKCLKKALYAIFPQVKYFFVREFDSPVTVDVSIPEQDFEIFLKGFENPITCFYHSQPYQLVKNELKILCSYAIRLIIFLQKRLEILNRTVIYDWSVKEAFPIDDIRKFRAGVTDIGKLREDFMSKVQLHEVPIASFTTTLLKPHHYPRRFRTQFDGIDINQFRDKVDLLTLINNGLLANDYKEH